MMVDRSLNLLAHSLLAEARSVDDRGVDDRAVPVQAYGAALGVQIDREDFKAGVDDEALRRQLVESHHRSLIRCTVRSGIRRTRRWPTCSCTPAGRFADGADEIHLAHRRTFDLRAAIVRRGPPPATSAVVTDDGWKPGSKVARRSELAPAWGRREGRQSTAREADCSGTSALLVRTRFTRSTLLVATYDDDGNLVDATPANFVMGRGRIDGRTVVVGGDDFTVRGGAAGASIFQKQVRRHTTYASRSSGSSTVRAAADR